MKAILIDPATETIDLIGIDPTAAAIAAVIGHEGEAAYLYGNGDALHTNRWGLKSDGMMFIDNNRYIQSMGKGLIVGRNFSDATTTINEARAAISFREWFPEPAPSRAPSIRCGDRIVVRGTLTTSNSSGGTHILRQREAEIEVVRIWYDYECGYRGRGRLVDPALAAEVRRQATSEYDPDWYRANRPDDADGLLRAEEALLNWQPELVSFSEHDLVRKSIVRKPR